MKVKAALPSRKKVAATTKKKKPASRSKENVISAAEKKPVAPSKGKGVSPATKRTESALTGKAVSTTKKKAASKRKASSATKRRTDTLAREKRELSNQVMDFVEAAFKGRRIAYFVLDTERTDDGAFIVCVAVENEPGFFKLDWGWHCSFTKAKKETALMNDKLGLTEEQVNEIIITTMGPPILH